MQSQPTTPITEKAKLDDKKNYRSHPKTRITWCAIGLLFILCLTSFFILGVLVLKNKDQLLEYQHQLSEIQTKVLKNQNNDEHLKNHISQLQNFITEKFSANNNIILLANVKQLTQLAHYNLTYLHNSDSALMALTFAQNQLDQIISSDFRLENLRGLVASSIASLKALPHIDIAATLAKLHDLQVKIPQLPLLSTAIPVTTITNATTNGPEEKKWIGAIQDSFKSFRQLIVIRRLDKPIEPLLPEAELQYLQHNLQLLLQQAQWALLHDEPAIYQSSLQQFQESVQTNFASDSVITQTIMQTINQLKKIDFPTFPLNLNAILEVLYTIKATPPTAMTTANQKETS
jgi:uroporphyrin-3 C-methyltransferase